MGKVKEYFADRELSSDEYMSEEEMKETMWNNRPICLLLDDGTWIIPQRDDEGNDGGSLYVVNTVKDECGNHTTLPVI